MSLSIYNIEQVYLELAQSIMNADGEVTEEQIEALAINRADLENKGRAYGFIVKSLEGENDIIDSEIKRLQGLKANRLKTIDRLKDTLTQAMELYEIEKLSAPTITISFRKSKSTIIENEFLIDAKFKSVKTVEIIDKAAIKKAIEAGEIVLGAIIQENKNIQIK